MRKEALAQIGGFSRAACRVQMSATDSGGLEFGLLNVSAIFLGHAANDGISWVFDPSASPNWRLRSNDGSTNTFTDSGIAVSGSTRYHLEIEKSGSNWVGRIDGAALTTRDSDLPADSLLVRLSSVLLFGTTGTRRTDIDFMLSRLSVSRGL
jgi:hypothetical protein